MVERRVKRDRRLGYLQLDVVEPVDDLVHRHTQVETGQVGAGAAVGTRTERDVPVALAVEVEGVGIGELRLVPVGGGGR